MKNRFLTVIICVIAIVSLSLVYFSSGAIKTAAALVYLFMCMIMFFKGESSSFKERILSIAASLAVLGMLLRNT